MNETEQSKELVSFEGSYQTELLENTVIRDFKVEAGTGLGFNLDPAVVVIVVTFLLDSFTGVVLGKLTEATWDTIKRLVDQLDKKSRQLATPSTEGVVRAVYRSEVKAIDIELTIGYANTRDLKRDLKNHHLYIAIALGYANANLPRKGSEISLLPCLPPEHQKCVLEFSIRKAPKEKLPNKR